MEDLPTGWTLVWQWYLSVHIEDAVFVFTHRLLHSKLLYKRIHKLHHTYTMPIGICAEYAHPIEFIFGNSIPFGVPFMLLDRRVHFFTFIAIGI